MSTGGYEGKFQCAGARDILAFLPPLPRPAPACRCCVSFHRPLGPQQGPVSRSIARQGGTLRGREGAPPSVHREGAREHVVHHVSRGPLDFWCPRKCVFPGLQGLCPGQRQIAWRPTPPSPAPTSAAVPPPSSCCLGRGSRGPQRMHLTWRLRTRRGLPSPPPPCGSKAQDNQTAPAFQASFSFAFNVDSFGVPARGFTFLLSTATGCGYRE